MASVTSNLPPAPPSSTAAPARRRFVGRKNPNPESSEPITQVTTIEDVGSLVVKKSMYPA